MPPNFISQRRLRVLIIAHECSPVQGSECATGWNIITRLSAYHDVTVLYASGSQREPHSYVASIDKFIQENGPVAGVRFVNIDQPKFTRSIASFNKFFAGLGSIGLPLLYYIGYRYWQKQPSTKQSNFIQHINLMLFISSPN